MVKIADALTFSRLVLMPVVAVLWLSTDSTVRWVGVLVFVVAGLTDIADGRIARRLNETTRFGSYVDPFADKMLVLGSAAVLVSVHRLWLVWFVVVMAREMAVLTLRSVLKAGAEMPASPLAKVKTLSQMFAVGGAAVLTGPLPDGLLVLSGVLTVWTGIQYLRHFWPSIQT